MRTRSCQLAISGPPLACESDQKMLVCVVGAAAAPLSQPRPLHATLSAAKGTAAAEDCANGYSATGGTVDDAWCNQNCAVGNCPADLCQCAGTQKDQAAPSATTPDQAAPLASNTTEEVAPQKIEEAVKVDMNGEKNLPFKHAIIGYYGAGPYTPSPFEGTYGDEGPSIADALQQGYNVICLSFADSFTGDGGFEVHTDLWCALPSSAVAPPAAVYPTRSHFRPALALPPPQPGGQRPQAAQATAQPRMRA